MKRALITGIAGMDGSYLADLLVSKGYEVYGLQRHSSHPDKWHRIKHLEGKVNILTGDVTDPTAVQRAFDRARPHEVYHEADQDSVEDSWDSPAAQIDVTIKGALNVIRASEEFVTNDIIPSFSCKLFLPLSATIFKPSLQRLDEKSWIVPRSPYAVCKSAIMDLANIWREQRRLWISCGILFSHDSPRRGQGYLLQRIACGEPLWGDTNTTVDIGHAEDYMQAAWLTMQQDEPTDWVIGTGRAFKISTLANCGTVPDVVETPSWIADSDKLRSATGWKPKHDAATVLAEIKDNLKRAKT